MSSFSRPFRKLCWTLIHAGPRRDITIRTANGLLTVDSKDWLTGKYLYIRREYETAEMSEALRSLAQRGSWRGSGTLLNAGANLGMTSIGAVKRAFFDRALAFEPDPNNFRLLTHNVRQNRLADRINCFEIALSSSDGQAELELSKDNFGDHRLRSSVKAGAFGEEKRRTVQVQTKTLDSLIACDTDLGSEDITLAWIDIQGHEGHFFEGARDFFSRMAIPAVCEFWPYGIERSGITPERFRAILARLFSHFFVIPGSVVRPVSELADLFGKYSGPRQVCQIALIR